jgi:PadR family transcriptional regulator PadR
MGLRTEPLRSGSKLRDKKYDCSAVNRNTPLDVLGEKAYSGLLDRQGETLDKQLDLLQGTLDLLILKALALGPMHGYGVSVRIQQLSRENLAVQQGSLYPALHRLEQQAWIQSEWGTSDNNRKAKFYSLTDAGRLQLERETANWKRLSEGIGLVLGAAEV